jgi:hypothetical protein
MIEFSARGHSPPLARFVLHIKFLIRKPRYIARPIYHNTKDPPAAIIYIDAKASKAFPGPGPGELESRAYTPVTIGRPGPGWNFN